jgi:hypothetical protein
MMMPGLNYGIQKYSVKCALCGLSWNKMEPIPCTHSQAEWDAYNASWSDPTRVAPHWLEDPDDPLPAESPMKGPWPPPLVYPNAPVPSALPKK